MPTVTSSSTGFFSRSTRSLAWDPGVNAAIRDSRLATSWVGLPSISSTTSRACIPARSAGPLFITLRMSTPLASLMANAVASSGVSSWGSIPSQPRVTSPSRMICSSTLRASETGMAKPMPCEPPLWEKIALLIPIKFPPVSTSAPPELPGLTAASVWMKSSNRLIPS